MALLTLCKQYQSNCSWAWIRNITTKKDKLKVWKIPKPVTDAKRQSLYMHRRNIENKILFGKLLETAPQRKQLRKNKVVNKPIIEVDIKNDNEDEAKWSEKCGKVHRIKFNTDSKLNVQPISVFSTIDNGSVTQHTKTTETRTVIDNIPVIHTSQFSVFIEDVSDNETLFVPNTTEEMEIVNNGVIGERFTTFPMTNENVSKPEKSGIESCRHYPSVTRILNATMPEEQKRALEKWKKNMIAKMGEDSFQQYQQSLLTNGKALHRHISTFLSGAATEDIPSHLQGYWQSVESSLHKTSDVLLSEKPVVHPVLKYKGIIDCVATYGNKIVLIDWKMSEKPKPNLKYTYDAPIQVAAYLGACNHDPNYSLKLTNGLVVVAYTTGQPATAFHLGYQECLVYWKVWLDRLNRFKLLQNNIEQDVKQVST